MDMVLEVDTISALGGVDMRYERGLDMDDGTVQWHQ